MKEQIKHLAVQAGLVSNQDDTENWHEYINDVRKFGELLILECVRHINEDYQRDYLTNWREDLSKSIKYHFGVNE